MPGPVTHIVFALAALNTPDCAHFDKQQFVVGTSFPDIRYLGVIKREETHAPHVTWQDIVTERSSFLAGMKLHTLVDQARERFLQKSPLYNLVPDTPLVAKQLKIVEDSMLYRQHKDWKTITSYFNTITEEERMFGITDQDIKRWHTFLQKYLSLQKWHNRLKHFSFWRPALKLRLKFSRKLPLKKETVNRLIDTTGKLEKDTQITTILQTFYNSFLKFLSRL